MNKLEFTISKGMFSRIQFSIVTLLLCASTAAYLFRHFTGHYYVFGLIPLVDVGHETSIPTYFSSLNLLLASFLLSLVARTARRETPDVFKYWLLLSLAFLYLSFDEATLIHEHFGKVYKAIGMSIPVFASHKWLPIGIMLALVGGLVFIPFLLKIDRRTAFRFVLAGTIFLTGAVGFEFIGALMFYTDFAVRGDLIYELRRIPEEGCEMFGIAYFNCILMDKLVGQRWVLAFDSA